jgi:hypothetical protein
MSAGSKIAILVSALLLGGCGAETISGAVELPKGYATYEDEGVSFAHPSGMRRSTQKLASGARLVRLLGPTAGGRPAAYVNFTVRPSDGEVFDELVSTTRKVFEQGNGAEVKESSVRLDGADSARRLDVSTPAGADRARAERSQSLLVKQGKRVLILTAGRQEGRDFLLDENAVVESFRLKAEK